MTKVRLTKDSFNLFNFRADGHGFICAKLGSIKIVEGYDNLENCANAARRWLLENEGMQIEY